MDALKALQSLGLGPKTSGPEGGKLLQQAQHIWSMLDDMAENDPNAYSRFIEKQGKEYQKMTSPPQPHMCVSTQFQEALLYVNIVSWPHVPKPKSAQDNIPLYAAPMDSLQEKDGATVSTVTIATNPGVLEEFGLEARDTGKRKEFINLVLDYVQHLCGQKVKRNFTVLSSTCSFKGDLKKAQTFFTDSLKKAMKKDEDGEKSGPAPNVDIPESMMSKLAHITSLDCEMKPSGGPPHKPSNTPQVLLPEKGQGDKQPASECLIQELNSEEVKLKQPKYTLEKSSSEHCLVLRVELGGVMSVSQCQLDISEDDVKLYVEGMYNLMISLPSPIVESEARAKFSKKQSSLTLHMPLLHSSNSYR